MTDRTRTFPERTGCHYI